jgi:predicted regulator of Ras-like GTPase activity (Roadblock/LC7/MglB family)
MQTVLSQLNAVPGVIGSLVCDEDGRLLANVFPPLFDAELLGDAARCLADGVAGLDFSPDTSQDLDLRFGEARIVVRPLPRATLLVLCSKATNHQFLALSASVAVTKLARLRNAPAAEAPEAIEVKPPAAPSPAPQAGQAAPPQGKRVPLPAKGLEELRRRLSEMAEERGAGEEAASPAPAAAGRPKDPDTRIDPKKDRAPR